MKTDATEPNATEIVVALAIFGIVFVALVGG